MVKFSEEKKQRVLKEVKIMSKLDSNYAVKYYNSWLESNHLYIQMELCSQSLKSVIKDKAIVFGRQSEIAMNINEYYICCEIFKEILECVQYLHESKPPIIHRDLKPDNILIAHNVRNNRFIKLCDFGLATTHERQSMSHTAGAGTSAYMAPEVHQSRYTIMVDIYSLGVIAQHLLDLYNNPMEKYNLAEFSANINKFYEMIGQMVQYMPDNRPTIAGVLESYNQWSVDRKITKKYSYNQDGLGNFGKVYKVSKNTDNRIYAVKKIRIHDLCNENKTLVKREAEMVPKLSSNFVVKCYRSWFESDYLYIQMEYCSQTLRTVLRDKWTAFGRQSPADLMNPYEYYISCEIFRELLLCIQYLHGLDPPIIHRDIKPDNILILYNHRNNSFLKLGDFGLVTPTKHDRDTMTHRQGVGTARYIAFEVFTSTNFDFKADIYSMGIIGYDLFEVIDNPTNNDRAEFSSMATKRPTSSRVLREYNKWANVLRLTAPAVRPGLQAPIFI
ncbi:unnamed protein product [Medioppia subpectinata]|uniref:Protein kinase domain-containing protein n=1 Tax=Medioppia subpectinata TaxID=1979941 RepID=A0A7R9KD55_9ACAR|nr:unnamed protein product [Medioppia subpectinata]CAG2100078.1 unnamed protein product [Medioppia subpectinata]